MARLIVLSDAATTVAEVDLEAEALVAAINRGERPPGVALPAGPLRAELRGMLVILSAGGICPEPGLPGEGGPSPVGPIAPHFTPRQRQVLVLLSQGLSDQQVALRLGITLATARTYTAGVRQKLDARSRGEAVARAAALGILV